MEEAKAGSLNLPTDEELLVHYLSRKIFSMPQSYLNYSMFLLLFPWDLRYFFCKTNGDINSRLISGRNGCGYWKAVGQNQLIVVPISHHQQQLLIGTKKALRFYHSGCITSRWFMHQYSLVAINNGTTQVFEKKLVISKKLGKAVAEQCNKTSTPKKRPLDEVLQDQSDPPSPSSNSTVTHISSKQSLELDQEVTSF